MSEKIHPPTPRRRQQAKEQGRAPRSSDVVSAGLLLATTVLLSGFAPRLAGVMTGSLVNAFQQPALRWLDRWQAIELIWKSLAVVALIVLPMLVAMMMCGIALNVLQTGWMFTPSKLAPTMERLSPLHRGQSILSARSLGRFVITLLKLIAIVAVAISLLRSGLPGLIEISGQPLAMIGRSIFAAMIHCCYGIGMTSLAFASVDYGLSRWQFERELMMTEQELREEMRDAERAKPPATARSQAVQGVA